jgi:NAD(P)-dependent dehydrogenase (short-subunit alcohol dehydrogenase family)
MTSQQQPSKNHFNRKSTAEEVTTGLDLTGKTALVTGCNSGIGFETMRVLAMRGAEVIGTARSLDTARDACAKVKGNVRPVACELTDLDSVARCADEVVATAPSLDMLICNAGVMMLPKLEQVSGVEKQFFTNHVGHFLLVNRLLHRVKAAPQGRIVLLSSEGHRFAPKEGIQFDNLSGQKGYGALRAYGQSKLANILMAVGLTERLRGTAVTANAVHPGVIKTNLTRHVSSILMSVLSVVTIGQTKSIPQGAATTCVVATDPALARVSGCYFSDCNPKTPFAHARNAALAERLWTTSEELVKSYL